MGDEKGEADLAQQGLWVAGATGRGDRETRERMVERGETRERMVERGERVGRREERGEQRAAPLFSPIENNSLSHCVHLLVPLPLVLIIHLFCVDTQEVGGSCKRTRSSRSRTIGQIYLRRADMDEGPKVSTEQRVAKRVYVAQLALDRARSTLTRMAQLEGEEQDRSILLARRQDCILAKGVSLPQFQNWLANKEEHLGIKVIYENESIIAVELASNPHSGAVASICKMVAMQDNGAWSVVAFPEHDTYGANGQIVSTDILIRVDGQYQGPTNLNVQGGTFPTVAIEVGVSQSMPDLHSRLGVYQAVPSIQLYITIKRYASQGMLATYFSKANNWLPTSIVSFGQQPLHLTALAYLVQKNWVGLCTGVGFGGPACNAPNIPLYMMQLPANTIFIGLVGGVPAGAPASYVLDLFRIQRYLL